MLSVTGRTAANATRRNSASAVADHSPLHKDPFDRILVAQARVEGFLLLTADKLVAKYGEGVKKV